MFKDTYIRRDRLLRILILIIINILFFYLICRFGLNDETKDDFLMQSYFMDRDGTAFPYHMWANTIWSFTIYNLQKLMPGLAWHYFCLVLLTLFALNFLVLWIIQYCKMNTFIKFVLCLWICFLVYYDTINTFNFTRNAGFLMSVGLLYIFNEKNLNRFLGALLLILGTVIRSNVAYIMIGFLCICMFCTYRLKINNLKIDDLKHILIIVLALFACLSASQLGKYFYNKNEEWVSLRELNNASASVIDYPIADYQGNLDKYIEIGISYADYQMLRTRMSNSDPSVFDSNKYYKISGLNAIKFDSVNSYVLLKQSILTESKEPLFILVFTIVLISLFTTPKENRLNAVLIFIVLFAYTVLFSIIERVVMRVQICVAFMALTSLLICCFKDVNYDLRGRAFPQVIIVSLVLINIVGFVRHNDLKPRNINHNHVEIYDYTENNKDYFYLFSSGCSVEYLAVENLLFSKNYWYTENTFYLTRFPISPHEQSKLEKYEIVALWRDCVDSDSIRLIDINTIDIIINYIREHYCPTASAVLVDTVNDFNIYRIVSSS